MTADEKKELVKKTWIAFTKDDLDAAFVNFADDVSWVVPGNMPGISGVKRGKDEIRKLKLNPGVAKRFPEGMKAEIHRVFADGDTVILEMTNRGKVSNGKLYENEYCFIFELEEGKICRIREYVDLQKVNDVVFS